MNIFKRILKIGQAEIHALVEKMEDPINLTQQGIQDMKDQLAEATEAYIAARALVIRSENAIQSKQESALDYENKAKLLLQKMQNNEIAATKAEELAIEALNFKKKLIEEVKQLEIEALVYQEKTKEISSTLDILKFNISKWEKELTTLRAKQKISAASEFANRQMANIDHNSTIEMLEKMKAKVEHSEAISDAYGELAKHKTDQDIDQILGANDSTKEELELLKKQLGLK